MQPRLRSALFVVSCSALAGCQLLSLHGAGKSPLAPLVATPESVGLEIFSARFPASDGTVNGSMWDEIDEQQIPSDTRRLLAQHGFRVGVVGTNPPEAMSKLLKLAGEQLPDEQRGTVDLQQEPTVTMRALYTQVGWRNELVTSKTYDELSLLERDGDQVRGRTYSKADSRFELKATTETDGRVGLELTPELHYGEPQQKWAASDGVLRAEAIRPKKTFEALRFRVPLAPGQMLVVSCLPDRQGSVGHYFFTEPNADQRAQKLILIRIAQAGGDNSFANLVGR